MQMRIDELAQRSETTTRNIRAYQARGLLTPPRLEGRTGYYDEGHLTRLKIITDLQQRGFSLAAIRETLDAWAAGGDLADVVGLRNIVNAPWSDEQPREYSAEELLDAFPEALDDPDLLERAAELGLIEEVDDGFRAPSPMLIEAGSELARVGVPLTVILDLVAAVRRDIADVADRFVGVVADHVWAPLVADGMPNAEQLREMGDDVRRLRPVALEVMRPFLARELQRAATAAYETYGPRPDEAPINDAAS